MCCCIACTAFLFNFNFFTHTPAVNSLVVGNLSPKSPCSLDLCLPRPNQKAIHLLVVFVFCIFQSSSFKFKSPHSDCQSPSDISPFFAASSRAMSHRLATD